MALDEQIIDHGLLDAIMESVNSPATLFLITDDPYATYSPGDKIRGTANLDLQRPLLAKYIIVSLLAGCRIGRPGGKPGSLVKQLSFLKHFKVPFHNKREDPAKQLCQGKHKWEFEFDLPSSNKLPPSFFYRDQHGSAEIVYCLVMCAYTSGVRGLTKENMCTLTIKYSPKRSPTLMLDTSLSQLCQSLLVKRPQEADMPMRRRRTFPRLLRRALRRQKLEEETFHITMCIPKYAVFSEHMDIALKVQSDNEDYSCAMEVRLTEVHYRLWSSTRIAYDQVSRICRHQVQSNVMTCGSMLAIDSRWESLRRNAPFRVQPRLHSIPLDRDADAFGTIGPSFGTQHIVREYSLDIDIFLSIYGQSHRVRFENNELILLPYEIHLENE